MTLFSKLIEAARGIFSGIKIVRPIKRLTMKIIGMCQVSYCGFIRKKVAAYTDPIQGLFVLTGNRWIDIARVLENGQFASYLRHLRLKVNHALFL
jgi:hypothetical protein